MPETCLLTKGTWGNGHNGLPRGFENATVVRAVSTATRPPTHPPTHPHPPTHRVHPHTHTHTHRHTQTHTDTHMRLLRAPSSVPLLPRVASYACSQKLKLLPSARQATVVDPGARWMRTSSKGRWAAWRSNRSKAAERTSQIRLLGCQ